MMIQIEVMKQANRLGILGRKVIPNDYNDIKREVEEFGVTI